MEPAKIGPQESLGLYKSFNTLWLIGYSTPTERGAPLTLLSSSMHKQAITSNTGLADGACFQQGFDKLFYSSTEAKKTVQ